MKAQFPDEQTKSGEFRRQQMRFANGYLMTDLPPTPLRQIGIIFMSRWPVRGLVAQSFSGN